MFRGRITSRFVGCAILAALAGGLGYWRATERASCPGSVDETSGPEPGFQPGIVDVGRVPWGSELAGDLVFVNAGRSSLTIRAIVTDCGCTALDESAVIGQTLEPGDSLPIRFTVRAGTNPGNKRTRVTLHTTSGRMYRADVLVDVVGTWSIEPASVDFGTVEIDGAETHESILTFSSQVDQVQAVEAEDAPWLTVRRTPRGSDGVAILVALDACNLRPGAHVAALTVRTNCRLKPDALIPVRVVVVPSLRPSSYRVGLVASDPKLVHFFDSHDRPVQIAEVHCDDGRIVSTIVPPNGVELRNPEDSDFDMDIPIEITSHGGHRCTIHACRFPGQ
ncbi:MAG: hypothetical protein CHACPFDD_01935 [Phycisphaerae bacterium]|nr:hypothetical protein [Phycisphaerae bacterium]